MANLKEVKERISSVTSTRQITSAMKMVAAAKMRRAQENMEQARPYTHRLSEMLDSLILEIDRNMLPEPKSVDTMTDVVAPRSELESSIRDVFAEVLDLDPKLLFLIN